MVISEILGAFGAVSFVYQVSQDYSETRSFYRKHNNYIWKKSADLDSEIFFESRFKYYSEYYYHRDQDKEIEDAINDQKNVLILGRPLAGKSRAVFEVLKKIEKSCFILKPRPVDIEIENYTFPKLPGNMKKVMFLDDLHIFAEKENFDYLFEVARKNKLIVVATCRSGFDYDLLEKRLPPSLTIESIFDKVVTYDKVPESQAQLIASNLDINWEEAEFDGTIGSLIMKLGPMKKRYKDLPQNEKDILRILRRLYCAGISEEEELFFFDTIQTFAKTKGIISNTNDLNRLLEALISKEFIENPVENVYRVEEIYLERVFDFGVKTQRISIFNDVIEIFSTKPDILFKIALKSQSLGIIKLKITAYAKIAIKAYEEALNVYTIHEFPIQYAMTQNNLGTAYWNLSGVRDRRKDLENAIIAYKEALKVRTFDGFPMDYAMTQNNIGIAYSDLADVEDKKDNLNKAITAYNEALVVYTLDEFPIHYAMILSNLGATYRKLADVEDKQDNLNKAIAVYNEALKLRTFDGFPIDYATTLNNLGVAYGNLADVLDKKNNLYKEITAYREALKVRTFDKFPIQYATTQNNLGIAYGNLAKVEEKQDNLNKEITAYNEALRVRTLGDFPKDYATTQNNLGIAYLELAQFEDIKNNLIRSEQAFKEALKVRTFDEFPMDYAIIQNYLGMVYSMLFLVEDKKINLLKASKAHKSALKVYEREKMEERAEPLRQILLLLQAQLLES